MGEFFCDLNFEDSIASEIMHISRRLFQSGQKAMENLNIGVGQLPILRLLCFYEKMTQRQLAEKIRVTPATVCGTVKRMERAGLVRRTAAEEDGRIWYVSATEEGRNCCKRAMQAIDGCYSQMLEGFSEEECRCLRDFAYRIGENLRKSLEDANEVEENENR